MPAARGMLQWLPHWHGNLSMAHSCGCLPEGIASSACSHAAHELCQVRRIEKEVFVLVPRMFRAFIKLAYECACQVWGSLVQMRLVPFAPSPSVALDPSFRPIPLGRMRSCKV